LLECYVGLALCLSHELVVAVVVQEADLHLDGLHHFCGGISRALEALFVGKGFTLPVLCLAYAVIGTFYAARAVHLCAKQVRRSLAAPVRRLGMLTARCGLRHTGISLLGLQPVP